MGSDPVPTTYVPCAPISHMSVMFLHIVWNNRPPLNYLLKKAKEAVPFHWFMIAILNTFLQLPILRLWCRTIILQEAKRDFFEIVSYSHAHTHFILASAQIFTKYLQIQSNASLLANCES